ncbi:hypothetical protein [Enterocloster bolteae]|uniref:hypothetical protein n=1 Tax=Enterocloster bolteae TaxID=208479 RepID=UPI0028DCE4E0|nr:hypothetical protein [Enterocloster bolteae]
MENNAMKKKDNFESNCIKLTIAFMVVSTYFFPYYWSLDGSYHGIQYGFPFGYLAFSEYGGAAIRQFTNINPLFMYIDYKIIFFTIKKVGMFFYKIVQHFQIFIKKRNV